MSGIRGTLFGGSEPGVSSDSTASGSRLVDADRDDISGIQLPSCQSSVTLAVGCDHAMPVVELVISPSKAGHKCSRSIDASRADLRRPEVDEQIERFWSHAPPVPSGCSVDEHAKAARVAWRRAAPREQAAPQVDWMDDEAWQARQFVLALRQEGYISVAVRTHPAPTLSDHGKPLASLQAKANQHQHEFINEFGENYIESSEAEHLANARADKQAAPVELIGRQPGTSALRSTELEWEDALHTLAKPKPT